MQKLFSVCFLEFLESQTGIHEIKDQVRPINITNQFIKANPKAAIKPESIYEGTRRHILELNDEIKKDTITDTKLFQSELGKFVTTKGLFDPITSKKSKILSFFDNLSLDNYKITVLDELLLQFKHLKKLNLSKNLIKEVENLPKSLVEIDLSQCKIQSFARDIKINTLECLLLSKNYLTDVSVENIHKSFPNLICLDLSFNLLCDLENVVSVGVSLKNLRVLSLIGNPLYLLPNVSATLITELKVLAFLDGKSVSAPENNDKKKLQDAQSVSNKISKTKLDDLNFDNFSNENLAISKKFKNSFCIKLAVQLIENVSGIKITPDQLPGANEKGHSKQSAPDLQMPTDIKMQCSGYYIVAQMGGNEFSSKNEISYLQEGEEDPLNPGIYKIAIPFKWSQTFGFGSDEYNLLIRYGIKVWLWETYPVVGEKGQINVLERCIGVKVITVSHFLISTTNERAIQEKGWVYDLKCLTYPETFFPMADENNLLEKYFKQEIQALQEPEQEKDAKKDPKKIAPIKKPPPVQANKKGTGKEVEIVKKSLPVLNYALCERKTYVVRLENKIYKKKKLEEKSDFQLIHPINKMILYYYVMIN